MQGSPSHRPQSPPTPTSTGRSLRYNSRHVASPACRGGGPTCRRRPGVAPDTPRHAALDGAAGWWRVVVVCNWEEGTQLEGFVSEPPW